MATVSHQKGSSSTFGLLAASSIFVGILAYATYYGFEENSMPELFSSSPAEDTSETPSLVQPGDKGIFASPTLANADDSVSEPSLNEITTASGAGDSAEDQPAVVPAANQTSKLSGASEALANDSTMPTAVIPATKTVVSMPGYSGYPADDQWAGYMNHRNVANLNGLGYYDGSGRSNGSGRGNGSFDGDGSFDFNMSFKGRARMDADSDIDGSTDLNGYSTYQNSHRYYQQPTVYTQYYQYR